MRFLIVPSNCVPFHAYTLDERPLGGTETAAIRLSEALARLGNDVTVLTQYATPPPSNPSYIPFKDVLNIGAVDVLIAVREWFPLIAVSGCKKTFFWTGDSYDQPHNFGIGDRRIANKIDALLAVSHWHAKKLSHESGFPYEKCFVLKNGVYLPYFEGAEPRKRKRLIYSSTPYRGLKLVPPIYLELKKQHPELELHIFSGYGVYSGPNGYDKRAESDFAEFSNYLKKLPDCYLHGNVKQNELAREFMKSSVLLYPNIFEETSCISVMEAQAAGCVVVTSDLGALRETVGDGGIVVSGKPGSPDYMQDFTAATNSLLTDASLFDAYSSKAYQRARVHFDWNVVAKRFEDYLLREHFSLPTHKNAHSQSSEHLLSLG